MFKRIIKWLRTPTHKHEWRKEVIYMEKEGLLVHQCVDPECNCVWPLDETEYTSIVKSAILWRKLSIDPVLWKSMDSAENVYNHRLKEKLQYEKDHPEITPINIKSMKTKTVTIATLMLFFTLMLLMIVSCTPQAPGQSTTSYGDYTIKVIDGCEYLEYDHGFLQDRVYSLTHKGNCKNHK
jgi:hypothetical protein